jgi:hypothetical protein
MCDYVGVHAESCLPQKDHFGILFCAFRLLLIGDRLDFRGFNQEGKTLYLALALMLTVPPKRIFFFFKKMK